MRKKRIFIMIVAAVLLFGMFPFTAFAAGASVSAPSSVSVGDTFSVKVKFSGSNIGAVQASFSYDSSVIKYVSGGGTSNGKIVLYTSAEGASSLSTTIKFKALKPESRPYPFQQERYWPLMKARSVRRKLRKA